MKSKKNKYDSNSNAGDSPKPKIYTDKKLFNKANKAYIDSLINYSNDIKKYLFKKNLDYSNLSEIEAFNLIKDFTKKNPGNINIKPIVVKEEYLGKTNDGAEFINFQRAPKPTTKPVYLPNDYWETDPDVLAFRRAFKTKYGEEPSRDPRKAKYDYDKAYQSGVRPVLDPTDGLYHWDSKYKHDDHPNRYINGVDTKTGKPVINKKPTIKPVYQPNETVDFNAMKGKQPIIVNDPNDPRLKAYNDSLSLYNQGEKQKKEYLNYLDALSLDKKRIYSSEPYLNKNKIKPISNSSLENIGSKSSRQTNGTYKTEYIYRGNTGTDVIVSSYINDKLRKGYDNYKKPIQPVIYQKPTINKKQVDPIIPLGLTQPDKIEPKLANVTKLPIEDTSRVQDARTYTGAKNLEKMKRPTKYINTGNKQGREEFAMGGNLNFYTNQIAQEDAIKQMVLSTVIGTINKQVGNATQGLTKAATMGLFGNGGNFNYSHGGELTEYKGNTHENGGIPIGQSEVEHGETNHNGYIFSDRLKVGNKTFAQLSKEIDKKYSKRTDDKLSKEGRERELNNLIQLQESTGMTNNSNSYPNGGYFMNLINKMNKYNANWKDWLNRDKYNAILASKKTYDIRGNKPRANTLDKNIARQDANSFKFEPPAVDDTEIRNDVMPPEASTLNPNLSMTEGRGNSIFNKTVNFTQPPEDPSKSYQMDQISPWWLAASNIGNLANLAMSRPDKVNLQRVKPTLIDPYRSNNILRKELRDQANASSANIRGTANTAGTYLASEVANRAKTNSIIGSKIAQSNLEALNTNAQILNNTSAQNAQIQATEQDLNQREKDASKTIKSNALSSIGNNVMQYGLDRANVNMTNKMIPYIAPPGYEHVENPDGTISLQKKKGSGSIEINFKPIGSKR